MDCQLPMAGRSLLSAPEGLDATDVMAMLSAVSAFLSAEVESKAVVFAVADRGQESLLGLLELVHSGTVLLASDPRDAVVKKQLVSLSVHGRADVVVTLLSGRDGVLAVRRGGVVCLGGASTEMPSITELAQREVRVVGPRDDAALVKKIGHEEVEKVLERSSKTALPTR